VSVRLYDKIPGPPPPKPDFWVTVNGDRGRIWQTNVGTRTFPVLTKNPEPGNFLGSVVMVYYVDFARVDARLRDRIERFLSERFNQTLDAVRHEIKMGGLPVFARDIVTPDGLVVGDEE
jgi:hypothetical protein